MAKTLSALLLAGVLALAACAPASRPVFGPETQPASAEPGALELGDVREPEPALAQQFAASVGRRFAGVELERASKELRSQNFDCFPPKAMGGHPPDRVCRRTLAANGCTHTWRVFLYEDRPARGLYDRTCGKDPLLGGPA